MTIGAVQAAPLTMANVFATIAANGVECTPIALKKVVTAYGKEIKTPSANCHQAIEPGIAQTVAYAMNQGVVTKGGEAETTQLNDNRKTFAKTGTNEDTSMLTGGFVPQVASFVAVGNAESPKSFNNMTINGKFMASWYGMFIATPAWKDFMNTYLDTAKIPQDNNYGNPEAKYLTTPSSSAAAPSRDSDRNANTGGNTNNGGNTNTGGNTDTGGDGDRH
ncbi:carboxypeptidase [Bifidobacterium mongoliense DSM 21395]|uniref:Carboxypeptidase n=2 Tax=Bifidobacterium mongoliense TaxID=518643 RepID=A0A087C7C2_9BIFI|nr:carboxypeptidase [Bifidobacterium mongoliense DSM 21395]